MKAGFFLLFSLLESKKPPDRIHKVNGGYMAHNRKPKNQGEKRQNATVEDAAYVRPSRRPNNMVDALEDKERSGGCNSKPKNRR